MVGAGLALAAVGGLTSAWLVSSGRDTVPVVAVARDVERGQELARADLGVVGVPPDASLATVPADRLEEVVGATAATGLLAGSLLTPDATTDTPVPMDGAALVGVAVTEAQRPAEPLVPGDDVRIVDTPPAQADPPAAEPDSIAGQVVAVSAPDEVGLAVVDVLVPRDRAADLAARAATGRVALVLDSRER